MTMHVDINSQWSFAQWMLIVYDSALPSWIVYMLREIVSGILFYKRIRFSNFAIKGK